MKKEAPTTPDILEETVKSHHQNHRGRLAGGVSRGRHDLHCDGSLKERSVPAALAGAAQLRATVNSSCYYTCIAFVLNLWQPRLELTTFPSTPPIFLLFLHSLKGKEIPPPIF